MSSKSSAFVEQAQAGVKLMICEFVIQRVRWVPFLDILLMLRHVPCIFVIGNHCIEGIQLFMGEAPTLCAG